MNWHMIISGLIVVVIKVVGMTFFLLYFPQVFGKSNDGFIPTESYGTTNVQNVSQIFGRNDETFIPTRSYGTVCPKDWDLHQGRCFFFSTFESSWKDSRDYCATKGSTLAIVNTPEKLKNNTDITGVFINNVKFFILYIRPSAQEARYSVFVPDIQKFLQDIAGAENYFIGLIRQPGQKKWHWVNNSVFNGNVTSEDQNFDCVTIGLSKTFDAASCDVRYRWICERTPK